MEQLSKEYLDSLLSKYNADKKNDVVRHALTKSDIDILSSNQDTIKDMDFNFDINVKTMKATNQKASGRCWIFAATNLLREIIGKKNNIEFFELSQSYVAFYDKLEKLNYFLDAFIEMKDADYDDRTFAFMLQGIGDGGHPAADGAQTHHAELPALQFKAHQAGLGALLTDGGVTLRHLPGQADDHAEHQVGHRHRGVARAVGHMNAPFFTVVDVHVVHAGEGHVDVFQIGAVLHDLPAVLKIGEDHRVGVLRAPDQGGHGLRPVIVGHHLHPAAHGLLSHGHQLFLGDTQGFQKRQFHILYLLFCSGIILYRAGNRSRRGHYSPFGPLFQDFTENPQILSGAFTPRRTAPPAPPARCRPRSRTAPPDRIPPHVRRPIETRNP